MKKVEVRELADMSAVAQEFLMGEEVEVILKKASRQQRRRILDFLSGLVFARGRMERTGTDQYLIVKNKLDSG